MVMMYVKFPLSLRNVEDLLHERGIDICHETVRLWWNRFGPMFAALAQAKPTHLVMPGATMNLGHSWYVSSVLLSATGFYMWRSRDQHVDLP